MTLKRTPLYQMHIELGAKMVEYAGFEMPVTYPAGISAEHRSVREGVGVTLVDARRCAGAGLEIDDGELLVGGAPGELLTNGSTSAGCHYDHLVVGLEGRESARRSELVSAEDDYGCLRSRMEG